MNEQIEKRFADARRNGYSKAIEALVRFSVKYDRVHISSSQCRSLVAYQLVEYDKQLKVFFVRREVIEHCRYFIDLGDQDNQPRLRCVDEFDAYAQIRGILRKLYKNPEKVRFLEALVLGMPYSAQMSTQDFAEVIETRGGDRVLAPALRGLFCTRFGSKPAEEVTLDFPDLLL